MLATLSPVLSLAGGAAGFGPGLGLFFIVIPLFWLTVFIVLFAIFGRRWRSRAHQAPWATAARGAEASLAERFAQGDIDEKEYRARLEVLRASNQQQHPGKS